jgi:hypothetical protein
MMLQPSGLKAHNFDSLMHSRSRVVAGRALIGGGTL